jgi:hypothetical protein
MKPLFSIVCSALAALTLAAPATSQWLAASGNPFRSLGNGNARSDHDLYGVIVSSPTHAYVRTDISNSMVVFGSSAHGGDVTAEAYTNTRTGTSRSALTTQMGSQQPVSETFATSLTRSKLLILSVFPIPPQITVMVAFLPVTLMANAGAIVSLNLALTSNLLSNTVSLTGSAYSALFGSASVLIGLSVAGAGVEARLELGRGQITAGLTARTGSISTNATASLAAIALRIVAFVNVFIRLGEVTLVDIAGLSRTFSGANFLN